MITVHIYELSLGELYAYMGKVLTYISFMLPPAIKRLGKGS